MRPWLARALEEASCDGILVLAASSSDPDLAAFVGAAHLGESFVVWPRESEPRLGYLTAMERDEAEATGLALLTPAALGVTELRDELGSGSAFWAACLARAFDLSGLGPCTLAAGGCPRLGPAAGAFELLAEAGWRFVDGSLLLGRRRKTKSAVEIDRARAVAGGTCAAMRRVAVLLSRAEEAPGGLELAGEELTVERLRREIALSLAELDLGQPEGNIVAAGPSAAVPHSRGDSDRRLRQGETIIVDLFPRGLVFADCTRTFVVGAPGGEIEAAHAVVKDVLDAAHGWTRPGTRGWDLQEQACARFAAAGFPTPLSHPGTEHGYVHGLGHGVGYELHEYPSFARNAGAEGTIEAGDLLTLEPGLYDPGEGWGVRLEDLCLVTADGFENLTPLPYDLDPRRWPAEARL